MAELKTTITVENKIRPCMVGKKKALFHRWAVKPDVTVGIVEYSDGTVHEAYPNEIRFIDDWVDFFHANV